MELLELLKKVWKFILLFGSLMILPVVLTGGRPGSAGVGVLLGAFVAISVCSRLQCPGCGSWRTYATGHWYKHYDGWYGKKCGQQRKCRKCDSVYDRGF